MKRIGIVAAATAVLLLALAGPATADYPPSPSPIRTHTVSSGATESPTTATPSVLGSETTRSPSASESVLGATLTKSPPGVGGTAFTGSDLVGPLALGAILLALGLALLYLGRRRAATDDR